MGFKQRSQQQILSTPTTLFNKIISSYRYHSTGDDPSIVKEIHHGKRSRSYNDFTMAAVNQNEELMNHDDDMKPLMVTVTAPATLPAGYTFEALLNDDPNRPFICEVVRTKLHC